MIRTGDEYRAALRDGREVCIDGERVADVTTHPAFKPLVDVRARIYAGHRLTFQLFAPPFAHLNAVYRSFDWDGPLGLVPDAAGLSDRVRAERPRRQALAQSPAWSQR